jgi:hypothetical protein
MMRQRQRRQAPGRGQLLQGATTIGFRGSRRPGEARPGPGCDRGVTYMEYCINSPIDSATGRRQPAASYNCRGAAGAPASRPAERGCPSRRSRSADAAGGAWLGAGMAA